MKTEKNSSIKDIAIVAAIAVLYCLVERTLNECCLFELIFGSKDLGYKISAKVGLAVWLAFAVFAVRKKLSFNFGAIIPVALFLAVILLSTVVNGLGIRRILDIILNEMSVLLLMVMLCQSEEGRERFASTVSWVFLFMVGMNVDFKLFYPLKKFLAENTYAQCFIGNTDGSGFALELGMFWALTDDCLNRSRTSKIKLILYIIVFYINVYYMLHVSGTTVVGAMIITAYLVFTFMRKIAEKTNLMAFVVLGLLLFVILVWFYTPVLNSPPVAFLLKKLFHKSLTLSGRTEIWPLIMTQYIYKKPILGFGVDSSSYMVLEGDSAGGVWHTNNQYLQTWYEGGLIAFAVFLLLMIMSAYLIKKMKNRRLAGIACYMIFVFLIVYNGDIQPSYQWPAVFEICCFAFLCSENGKLNSLKWIRQY